MSTYEKFDQLTAGNKAAVVAEIDRLLKKQEEHHE